MLVIVENNKITGIEKNLLSVLETDLNSLSDLINTLNLQLSSIQNTLLNVKDKRFSVNEIEILSAKNIKVFNLKLETEETVQSSDFISQEPEIKAVEETAHEPVINLINEVEKAEDFLVVPQIEHEEETPSLNIGIIEEKEKYKETEQEQKPENKLIDFDEEKIEFEAHKIEKIPETQQPESEIIEISFEDDLEEVIEILKNKKEFNSSIETELKKASEELGIDYNELKNWYEQLIEQIKDEKALIYKYINQKDYNSLHKSYHKLKGAALNLRLSQIALVLKKLDELSKNKEDIEKIKLITDDFYNLIENKATAPTEQSESTDSKDKHIEDIIIKTIQTYLNTQNEAQFQKDKKYIEKLLNTKIDSIKDLQKIIKGM